MTTSAPSEVELSSGNETPLVLIDDVSKTFRTPAGTVRAVDRVGLSLGRHSTLGVVGESGSGKSTLARIVLGFHRPDTGEVYFRGQAISSLDYRRQQRLRSDMTVVFQEPLGSLNPRIKVLQLVREPLDIHRRDLSPAGRSALAAEALERVRLSSALFNRYPRQLSGGQQQRVNIARAIVTSPGFIVLDEPTSALDLSVQAQVLELLQRLQVELGLSYLFISHDIGCIGYLSHRIAVMCRGRVVELGPAGAVLDTPVHSYTKALLSARLLPYPPQGGRRQLGTSRGGQGDSGFRWPGGAVDVTRELAEVAPGHFAAV